MHSSTTNNKTISEFHAYFSVQILLAEGGVGGEEDVLVPALVAGVLGPRLGGPPARAQEGREQPALSRHHLVLGTEVNILTIFNHQFRGRVLGNFVRIFAAAW